MLIIIIFTFLSNPHFITSECNIIRNETAKSATFQRCYFIIVITLYHCYSFSCWLGDLLAGDRNIEIIQYFLFEINQIFQICFDSSVEVQPKNIYYLQTIYIIFSLRFSIINEKKYAPLVYLNVGGNL